jgi:hypothetical protein
MIRLGGWGSQGRSYDRFIDAKFHVHVRVRKGKLKSEDVLKYSFKNEKAECVETLLLYLGQSYTQVGVEHVTDSV